MTPHFPLCSKTRPEHNPSIIRTIPCISTKTPMLVNILEQQFKGASPGFRLSEVWHSSAYAMTCFLRKSRRPRLKTKILVSNKACPIWRQAFIGLVFCPVFVVKLCPFASHFTRSSSNDCAIRANNPQYVRPNVRKKLTRALFWYTAFRVPSRFGANGFLHVFQPARIMAWASARFLAAFWRHRFAAKGLPSASELAAASKHSCSFFLKS